MDRELAAVFKSKLAVPSQEVEPLLKEITGREFLLALPLEQEPASNAPKLARFLKPLGRGDGRTDALDPGARPLDRPTTLAAAKVERRSACH